MIRFRTIVADVVVSSVIYLLAYHVMRGSFRPTDLYLGFGGTLLISWVAVSAYFEKYRYLDEGRRGETLSAALWVTPIVLGIVTTLTAVTPLWQVARSFLLVSVAALGLGTPVVAAIVHLERSGNAALAADDRMASMPVVVPWRVLVGAATILLAFGLAAWLKTGSFVGYPLSGVALLVVAGSWAATASVTHKYVTAKERLTLTERYVAHTKSVVLMLMVAATAYFMLRLDELSRWMLFGSPLLFGLLEAPWVLVRAKPWAAPLAADGVPSAEVAVEPVPVDPAVRVAPLDDSGVTREGIEQLAHRFTGVDNPRAVAMQQFLLGCRVQFSTKVVEVQPTVGLALASGSTGDLHVQADRSLPLLANLRPLNHIGPLNDYLREANRCLWEYGLLCGVFRPLESVRAAFQRALPPGIRQVLYFGHFVFFRVLPRVPVTRVLYSRVFRAPQRALTRTEAFGRLRFCGFRVIFHQEVDGHVYLLAQREQEPRTERPPSYGPLIRLERRGHRGETVGLYKVRTMHAYSEYLQPDLFVKDNLDDSGKPSGDVRVTRWGRVLRRYWLDEAPQILNWFRGEVRLVGVRAVSAEYLSLLPPDLQALRMRVRPGLIPPYYADLPQNFDQIVESERRYLTAKLERPLVTDVMYLIRVGRNIVAGARSG